MPYTLSPSTLSLLKDCPRCFYLHIKKQIKRPKTIFPSLPSGMDKVLKEYFDYFMEKNKLPPELKLKDVKLFNNKELLKIWRSNFKGIIYKDKNNNILRGAVDNILTKDNKLIVLDYKTRGFPLKEDTHEHYQDQLNIYNYLLQKNNYKTQPYSYLLFYYPKEAKGKNIIFNTDLIKMNINIKNAENLWKQALKTLNGPLPSPSKDCEFCKWKKLQEL